MIEGQITRTVALSCTSITLGSLELSLKGLKMPERGEILSTVTRRQPCPRWIWGKRNQPSNKISLDISLAGT